MGPSWVRSKVIQSDMAMGNWNVKLLLNSKVKGQRSYSSPALSCLPVYTLYGAMMASHMSHVWNENEFGNVFLTSTVVRLDWFLCERVT